MGVFSVLAATAASGRSHACGGCFPADSQTASTVVVAHRMAFSISPTRSVLWDQVQYSGSPDAFAWVLPVKSGAYLELSNDAWFEALDAATTTQVTSPEVECSVPSSSSGCHPACVKYEASGSWDSVGGEEPAPVAVVHQGSVGPYETVTLHANVPNALPQWLTDHGFAIGPDVAPMIDAYTTEGFDFIAIRLLPGQGIDRMKPVRVVMPGAAPTLPLRTIAAGTGAKVAITLYVIGEGRYQAQNFPNDVVDPEQVEWDFDAADSNYAKVRDAVMAQAGGRTWNTAYARQHTLLGQIHDDSSDVPRLYLVDGAHYDTIAEAYVQQAIANQEGTSDACVPALREAGRSLGKVVAACDAVGGDGAAPVAPCMDGEVDGRTLACGTVDDVAVALVGLHPQSVWITRLEASLPHSALADDLVLGATGLMEVDNQIQAAEYRGNPCVEYGGTPLSLKRPIRDLGPGSGKAMIARGRTPPLALALAVAALAATVGRRFGRARKRA